MIQDPKNLEGLVNDAVESNFMDELTCVLEIAGDRKKKEMFSLMQNFFAEIVK